MFYFLRVRPCVWAHSFPPCGRGECVITTEDAMLACLLSLRRALRPVGATCRARLLSPRNGCRRLLHARRIPCGYRARRTHQMVQTLLASLPTDMSNLAGTGNTGWGRFPQLPCQRWHSLRGHRSFIVLLQKSWLCSDHLLLFISRLRALLRSRRYLDAACSQHLFFCR